MKERESSKDSAGSPEQLWEKWAAYSKRTFYTNQIKDFNKDFNNLTGPIFWNKDFNTTIDIEEHTHFNTYIQRI